ncbi:MAG: hypothetical protein IJZ30_07150 [Alphaproteobacteria bacterium]|nr:hypothetical protein [Alphaproteobacteria bacterium]
MKTKSKVSFMYIMVIYILSVFLYGCSEENYEFSSISPSLSNTTIHSCQWSMTEKNDTTILLCIQNARLENDDENFSSVVTIKLYKQKDTIYFNKDMSPTPSFKDKKSTTNNEALSPSLTKHTIKKTFLFDDDEVIHLDATYYSQTVEKDGQIIPLPYVSISSADFNNVTISKDKNNDNQYLATLEFIVNWEEKIKGKKGQEKAYIEYSKVKINTNDELLKTSYNQGYDWIDNQTLSLFVEKVDTWSISGEKRHKYASPSLDVRLLSSEYKTLDVTNFDFTKELTEETTHTDLIEKDNWTISKDIITKKLLYTNQKETFSDTFSYPYYDVSFELDEKVFSFDLGIKFSVDNNISTTSDTHKSNTSTAQLEVASKQFEKKVVTVLKLIQDDTPPSDDNDDTSKDDDKENDDENIPPHGRIITHYISAIYDVANSTTKKCVVVRYEEGYDWGVCEYEESFPSSFTYTQTGYSGFNSVAQSSKTSPFRLARVVEKSNAIYWYQENNKLISAIDFLSCKEIGWKHIKNGKYCSLMDGYQEDFTNNSYTLTLTASDGTSKTFKSSKRK